MDGVCTALLSLLGDLFEIFHWKEFKKKPTTILCKPSKRRGHHQSYFKAEDAETQRQGSAGRITQPVCTPMTGNEEHGGGVPAFCQLLSFLHHCYSKSVPLTPFP